MASRAVNLVDHLGGWLFRSNWHLLWILPSAQGISHAANTSFEVRVKNHKNLEAIRVTTQNSHQNEKKAIRGVYKSDG